MVIQYRSTDRLLQGAERVWAHVGHSGWQHTLDVELFRSPQEDAMWTGIYKIPASQLATPSHVEVQIVFKGQMQQGHIVWDNNEGNNWQVRGPTEVPSYSNCSSTHWYELFRTTNAEQYCC